MYSPEKLLKFLVVSRMAKGVNLCDSKQLTPCKKRTTQYPEGLKEEGIPLIARLCAIADTYDAVVSDRPYRKGVEAAIALNELRKAAGTQLDPYLVRCLLEKPDWMRI